jgi:hypothetical protein
VPTKPKKRNPSVKKVKLTKEELEALKQRKFEEGIEAAGAAPEEVKAKLRGAEDEYEADMEIVRQEAYEDALLHARRMVPEETEEGLITASLEADPFAY